MSRRCFGKLSNHRLGDFSDLFQNNICHRCFGKLSNHRLGDR